MYLYHGLPQEGLKVIVHLGDKEGDAIRSKTSTKEPMKPFTLSSVCPMNSEMEVLICALI